LPCPQLVVWAIATGVKVLSYDVSVDGVVTNIDENQIEVCFDSEGFHTLRVVTVYDLDGETWHSVPNVNEGTLDELRPPDWVPPPTVTTSPIPVPFTRPSAAICADLDEDGVVGFSDFGIFSQVFGTENDGEGNVIP